VALGCLSQLPVTAADLEWVEIFQDCALSYMHTSVKFGIRDLAIRPDCMLGQTAREYNATGVMPFRVPDEVIRSVSCRLTASGSRLRGGIMLLNECVS
jgi:hypothetical protein